MIKVHSYESMGTYDGPGLRLVVFLQGCPFRCLYCANPDTIAFDGGTPTEIDHIVNMAVNQKPFFGKKGGVTFSGGEPTAQAKELLPAIDKLKENGIPLYAAHLKGDTYPYGLDLENACAFIIGNEARGLSDDAADLCDRWVKIPMPGQAESLNASIAAGVLMYEVVRQRLK